MTLPRLNRKSKENFTKMKDKCFFSTNAVKLENGNITTDGDVMTIKGYACHFGKPNLNGEVVTKDSFDEGFKLMAESTVMPTINLMHSPVIVGGWDKLTPDDKGLYVEGRIILTPYVKDNIAPLITSGFLSHLSTEGYVTDWESKEDYYVAKNFFLLRISLVDIPADFQAAPTFNALSLNRRTGKKTVNSELLGFI